MEKIGLTTSVAKQRLALYGLNQIPSKQSKVLFSIIFRQIKSFLIILLALASILSLLIGDRIDAFIIFATLVLNTALGTWQEYKASKEIEALRKLEVLTSRVIRDNHEVEIPSYELVPGDVVILESGDKIPADGNLIEAYNVAVNESSLTGESLSVIKTIHEDNHLYFGTTIIEGRAKIEVTQTGGKTRFGHIALTLATVEEKETPFEGALNRLGKRTGIGAVCISIVIFIFQLTLGKHIFDAFLSSTALMVATVPEGLPAVITVLLAIGVNRMYKKQTLVRKMSTIESLGATNVICTDKTGTLTKNEMRVKEVLIDEKNKEAILTTAIICNNASLALSEKSTDIVLGDTTEGALLLWARDKQKDIDTTRKEGTIVEEIPFDLKRRLMAVLFDTGSEKTIFAKGAPEAILPLCHLTAEEKETYEKAYQELASRGLRVLAFAQKLHTHKLTLEKLTYLGLIGIADEPRPEAKEAVLKARKAGITIVMITGDNELTARAIGREIGLLEEHDEVLTGQQLQSLSEEELLQQLDRVRIFARVLPEQKLIIVRAFQKKGKIVAVTGDGVNDALALKQADVGVAMGKIGTDVAKESADIIILNDNIATIIEAIEQGRIVYSNMVSFVRFLMAGNLSEVIIISFCTFLGIPTVLFPIQILWINFVSDGLPALSLTADMAKKDVMSSPPRDAKESVLNKSSMRTILFVGVIVAAVNLIIFFFLYQMEGLEKARTTLFSTMVITQMIAVFFLRQNQSFFSNKYLLASVGFVLAMQACIALFPPLQLLFKL